METIQFRIESRNGDDLVEVPKDKVAEKVDELIKNGSWATLNKKDGTTETITEPVKKDDWKETFGKDASKVSSVVGTSKMKGG